MMKNVGNNFKKQMMYLVAVFEKTKLKSSVEKYYLIREKRSSQAYSRLLDTLSLAAALQGFFW